MSVNVSPKVISGLRAIAEKYAIGKIVVFGSRARGDNNSKSDIDIAIYPMTPITEFENKGHFISEVDDLDTLLKIDIIFVNNNTDEKLIANIQKEGVVIYERLLAEA